jgi:hypothetical protein
VECCRGAESINIGRVDSDLRRYGWPQADENRLLLRTELEFSKLRLARCDAESRRFQLQRVSGAISPLRLARTQALLSYTWSHSIDDASSHANRVNVPPGQFSSVERPSSDYDIRNMFSGAVSYDIPTPSSGVLKQIFGNWSTDSIVYVRSAPPVNVVTGKNPFPGALLSGSNSVQRPNVVPGVPFYLYPSGAPGGKVINSAAFSDPGNTQGDLGRNAPRGSAPRNGIPRYDASSASRKDFLFIPRRLLQHPESPERRQSDKLSYCSESHAV